MHERSLVQSLLTQVEQIRRDHQATAVDVITVELGPLSGVETELVLEAFQDMVTDWFDPLPELHIAHIPLNIHCLTCGVDSDVEGLTLECPGCSSVKVKIQRGDEFRLLDVSLQVPVEEEP